MQLAISIALLLLGGFVVGASDVMWAEALGLAIAIVGARLWPTPQAQEQ